ncbi:fido domain-containing protein [Crassisporium funariophilum]|nr:fido domain-containing protein [Crassisporium funariophilum]
MSDLHLTPYLNADRPQLQQTSVTVLPVDALGSDLSSQHKASLTVDSSNGIACAASARLWERLLEEHRLPYLLLRVADMRMSLGSKVTALTLYEELQTTLEDPHLARWLTHSRSSVLADAERQLFNYKNNPLLGFSPSQRWRSTAEKDNFPYCKLQRAQINVIRDKWQNTGSPADFMAKFLNIHCLETNVIEGTLQFDPSATARLIEVGFYEQAEPMHRSNPIGGAVRNRADALSILQDTHKALKEIYTFLDSDPMTLTVEIVCRLHAKLMQTSQVLFSDTGSGFRLSYLNIGRTRQTSRVNVTAGIREQGLKIQFCPYDEVEAELTSFCKRFNELIQQPDMDPFASAAWISHVLVTIHPFEDGNGRLSRILASIPLLRSGLLPLCIPAFYKPAYNVHLNNIRANRDGDYEKLMTMFYDATKASLDMLASII